MESNDKIQFIDLDGVDEPECVRVHNILFGADKMVSVPSRKPAPPPAAPLAQPPPPPQHQPPPQLPPGPPPPMVAQTHWDQRPMDLGDGGMKMMYPVMPPQPMVPSSQYQVLMPGGQNLMYMMQSQYKKEDDYRAYQQPPPPPQHPVYIGSYQPAPAYAQPNQFYYSQAVYMAPQMQPEMAPVGPPDMYMPQQQEPLNLAKEPLLPPPVEASNLQPTAPAFLPSFHGPKPPATFTNNLQLRPTAPAFQPPPPQQIEVEEVEVIPEPMPEDVVVVVEEPEQVAAAPEPIVEAPAPPPVEQEPPKQERSPQPTPVPAPIVKKSWASIVSTSSNTDPLAAPETKPRPQSIVQQSPQEAPIAPTDEDKFSLAANNNNNNISKINNHLMSGADDMADDPFLYRLGEHLSMYGLDHHSSPLQPRGLTNRSNWCYVNATLQALVACPPFYNLMRSLPVRPRNSTKFDHKSKTPIIDAIMEFMQEFNSLPAGAKPARREKALARKGEEGVVEVPQGPPFEPSCVHAMLSSIRSAAFKVEGRQEDAEEFLSCLLNGLNDEMLDLMKLVDSKDGGLVNGQAHSPTPTANGNADLAPLEDEDSWTVMKSRNRGCVTRRADFGRTPISDIFRGQLCSHVQRKGDQQTENVQPFYTLQLDIERASSVKEALEQMVDKDRLEGMTCSKTHQQVEAWQQVNLEELPPVLLLHLKWFDYKPDGCSKIMKTVEYTVDLRIENKILSSKKNTYTVKQKVYKLFAVVYHDGKEASKGHYIADAYNSNLGIWVRYDDSQVRVVPENVVLHPKSPSVPYILYYRRSDTMGQPSSAAKGSPADPK